MLLSSSVETPVEFDEVLVRLEQITSQFNQCQHLETLLDCSTRLTQQLFGSDRVLIYQFVDGGDGAVTAESVMGSWTPILGQLIYDPCFEMNWGEKFRRGELTAIADIEQADLDVCYVDLMRRLQVRANLVSPILVGPLPADGVATPTLWGLLIVHQCSSPCHWRSIHRRVIKYIATHLGFAIQYLQMAQQLASWGAQQTQWQAALEAVEYAAWDWNLETDEITWAPQWRKLLECRDEDLATAARPLWESLIHPDDRERVNTAIAQHLNQATLTYQCEYRLRRQDGQWRWVLSQGKVTERRANGDPLRFWGLTLDISDRKNQELALQQQAQRERALNEVVEAIRCSLELDEIFKVAVAQIAQCLGSRARISQYLPEVACWRPVAIHGGPYGWDAHQMAKIWADVPDADNPLGTRLKQLATVRIDDTQQLAADAVNGPLAQQFPGQWLLVPIVMQQSTWGAVSLTRPVKGVWRSEEIDLIQRIADHLAMAIYHANLHRQIRTAHERNALVLQSINEGIWDWNPKTDVVQVSDRYWEFLGYDPEEQEATTFQIELQRFHPAERESFSTAIAAHLAAGTLLNQELRIQHQQGHYIWIRTRGKAIQDEQGQPVRMVGSIEDISDRKQTELRLEQQARQETALSELIDAIHSSRELEQIFALAVEHIADCVSSRVLIVQYLAAAECWRSRALSACPEGWRADGEALLRRDIPDGGNPIAAQLKQKKILKVDDTAQLERLNHRGTTEWARRFPGAWLLVPILMQEQVWGSLALMRPHPSPPWSEEDIVLARRVASKLAIAIYQSNLYQQLQTTNRRDELVLRGINEGIWDWHPESDRMQVSDRYWEILGYDPAEQGPYTFAPQELGRIHPADLDAYVAAEEQHLRQRRPFQREVRMRHRDGHYLWIRDRGQAVWNEQGQPIRMVGSIEDISERKMMEARLRQQEEEFRTLVENNPDGILRVNRQFQFLYVNPIVASRTGIAKADFVGKTFAEIGMPEHLIHLWQSTIAQVFATGQEQLLETEETLALTRHTFYSRIVPEWDDNGQIVSVLIISRDMTNLRAAQEALRQRAEREHTLRLMTQHIRETLDLDAILSTAVNEVQRSLQADRALIFRLHSDHSGQVIAEAVRPEWPVTLEMRWEDENFSPECYAFYRQGRGRIVPDVAQDEWGAGLVDFLVSVGVQSKMVAPILQQLEAGPVVWGLFITHACATQRQWQIQELSLLQQVADQLAIAIQQSELHQRLQAANRELERISTTDALTQIANRRHFDHILETEWLRTQRAQREISLILCDIDYFKQYNDTYGHPAGDVCIAAVAQALQRCVNRSTDCLARYGGEEFAIILPHTNREGAILIVQKMQAAIAALEIEHQSHGSTDFMTLSFGIATVIPRPTITPQALISLADRALYRAKQSGRDSYAVANTSDLE